MAKKSPVLIAKGISLNYQIKALRNNKSRWTKLTSAVLGHKKTINALQEMSLQLNSGEVICLVGNAGSGKSALIETLAGAVKPTTGEIWALENPFLINGSFAFFSQLSGAENVRLSLLSKGIEKEALGNMAKEIISSAKINKIAHNPISSYSSTTKKKLMMEVAFSQNPKVLLIDQRIKLRGVEERTEFQNRIKQLAKSGSCIVFVGLSPKEISDLCTRMIWLDHGQVKEDGTVKRVLPLFRNRKV